MKTKKAIFFLVYFVVITFSIHAQTPEADDLNHEKWEYVLEDSGDILQIAITAIAGLTTIIIL